MLVCIPTSNAAGLESTIHEHFGSAPYFTLINTESDEVQILENCNSHHVHGTCHPMSQLCNFRIDTVMCLGMGRRAVGALNAEGIRTLITDASTVGEALDQLARGIARDMNASVACHGHGRADSGSVGQ